MKTFLKLFVVAAAFGIGPAALAQQNPNVQPQLSAPQAEALPAQPGEVSAPAWRPGTIRPMPRWRRRRSRRRV